MIKLGQDRPGHRELCLHPPSAPTLAQGPDLAGIRDPAAVAKLPANEREACEKLWADVAALLKMIAERK